MVPIIFDPGGIVLGGRLVVIMRLVQCYTMEMRKKKIFVVELVDHWQQRRKLYSLLNL